MQQDGERDRRAAGVPGLEADDLTPASLKEAGAVVRELADAGIQVPKELTEDLALYLTHIREYGRRINLVAGADLERVGRRHLLESYNVLNAPIDLTNGPLADVGSGAGVPGIPLALLLPHLEVALIESVGKKARFLERVVGDLGLASRVKVVMERVEDLSTDPEFRGRFAAVTMRGLGPLPRVVPWCAPLLRPRGILVAFKGTEMEKELKQAMSAIVTAGLELLDIVPLRWGEGRLVLLQRGD